MAPRVFIDGHIGTTGLRIREWMADRRDLELRSLPDDRRKDRDARREEIEAADLAVLCLPDDAAREAAEWARNRSTRLIDTSASARVADGWVFGLPELAPESRAAIRQAKTVANPGCYATGFLLLVRPLIDAGLLASDVPLTVNGLSGYTGGGRSMIERWEDPGHGLANLPWEAPYALDRLHKHIPEMVKFAGLSREPHFVPAVGPYRCGMRVLVPLPEALLGAGRSGKALWEALHERYQGEPFVSVIPIAEPLDADEQSFDPRVCNDTNRIELRVLPHPSGHVLLMAILDNLGKGACGTAIQCLNLMLGFDETTGLPS